MSQNLRDELAALKWVELRTVARQQYGVNDPSLSKEDLLDACCKVAADPNRSQVVVDRSSVIQPGWARIQIARGNTPETREPVQVSVNVDTNYTILRGHVVDVPIKILDALLNAKNDYVLDEEVELTETNPNAEVYETSDYIVTVHGKVDGPDPRPNNWEKAAQNRFKKVKEFARQRGAAWMGEATYLSLTGIKPRQSDSAGPAF